MTYFNPQLKPKTEEDSAYIKFLCRQKCCACEKLKTAYEDIIPSHGKPSGTSKKGSDYEAVPLCHTCHMEEHRGRKTFWRKVYEDTGKTREDIVRELLKKFKGGK